MVLNELSLILIWLSRIPLPWAAFSKAYWDVAVAERKLEFTSYLLMFYLIPWRGVLHGSHI